MTSIINMENAQSKVESKNDAAEEVRNTDQIDAQSMKKEENSENASAELLEKIKDQVELENAQVQVESKDDTADEARSIDQIDTKSVKKEENNEHASAELLDKIKNQVEYYFGDVNLHKDKFLIEQTKLDEGWIPMTVMLNFNMLANLSKDADTILKALETSTLVEVSEDKKKIRRSPERPLPIFNEEYRKMLEARTVYVKGFPLTDMNVDKFKIFFEPYKPFDTIIMRKYKDTKDNTYKFKGSIYVQFETLDAANAFMALESVKYKDTELLRKWSADYAEEKAQEKDERRKKKSDDKSKKWKDVKQEQAGSKSYQISVTDVKLPKGSIIRFSGATGLYTRENIKETFNELGADIAYIDFVQGSYDGWIRLQGEDSAKQFIEKTDNGKVTICDSEITCKVLEGEEEEEYLSKVKEGIRSKNKFKMRSGKKGRAAKRRNGSSNDSVPTKKKFAE